MRSIIKENYIIDRINVEVKVQDEKSTTLI